MFVKHTAVIISLLIGLSNLSKQHFYCSFSTSNDFMSCKGINLINNKKERVMKMKAVQNRASTFTKTEEETQTPQSDTFDDLHFSFFSADDSEINAGIGVSIDPSRNFNQSMSYTTSSVEETDLVEAVVEAAEVDAVPLTDEKGATEHQKDSLDIPAAESEKVPSFGLTIHSDESTDAESTDPEPNQSELDIILEKSEKLFAETRKAIDTTQFNLSVSNLNSVPSTQGTLYIDKVDDEVLSLTDEQLEQEYANVNRKTAADRVGIAVDWTIRTLFKDPVKVLFTVLHNGIKSFFSSIGNLLKWGFFSIVLIVCFYVLIGNFSDSGQSAEDMIFQAYEAVKKVLVTLYKEVSSNFGGKNG